MKIQEFMALCVMLFLVVMCNTKQESSHRALFVKICEVDSVSQISCEVYFFEKIDTSQNYSQSVLDSVLIRREKNFVGKNVENLPYLHYIQSDTINFIIHHESSK